MRELTLFMVTCRNKSRNGVEVLVYASSQSLANLLVTSNWFVEKYGEAAPNKWIVPCNLTILDDEQDALAFMRSCDSVEAIRKAKSLGLTDAEIALIQGKRPSEGSNNGV